MKKTNVLEKLKHNNLEANQEMYIIRGLREPLLGRQVNEALHCIKRVKVKPDRKETSDFKKEYSKLLTGQ